MLLTRCTELRAVSILGTCRRFFPDQCRQLIVISNANTLDIFYLTIINVWWFYFVVCKTRELTIHQKASCSINRERGWFDPSDKSAATSSSNINLLSFGRRFGLFRAIFFQDPFSICRAKRNVCAVAAPVTVDTYLIEAEERDVTTMGRRCNGSSGDRNQRFFRFSLSFSLFLSLPLFLSLLSLYLSLWPLLSVSLRCAQHREWLYRAPPPLPHWLWYTREISGQDLVHPFASCPAENLGRESPLQPIEMFLLSLKWIPRVGKQGEHRANDRGKPPPPRLSYHCLVATLLFHLVLFSSLGRRRGRAAVPRTRQDIVPLIGSCSILRNLHPILPDPLNVSREPY